MGDQYGWSNIILDSYNTILKTSLSLILLTKGTLRGGKLFKFIKSLFIH